MVNAGASDPPTATEHARLEEEFTRLARQHATLVAHPEDREGHIRHLKELQALIARLRTHVRHLQEESQRLRGLATRD